MAMRTRSMARRDSLSISDLPPELLEKILIKVLIGDRNEVSSYGHFRMDGPGWKLKALKDFLACRGICSLWRECVDNIIKKMDTLRELETMENISITYHKHFASFAVPIKTVLSTDLNEPDYIGLQASRLLPHFKDFILHNFAMRSAQVSQEQDIPLVSKEVILATISSQYAIMVLASNEIEFYRLTDMSLAVSEEFCVSLSSYKEIDERMVDMIIINSLEDTRKEYLICRSMDGSYLGILYIADLSENIPKLVNVPKSGDTLEDDEEDIDDGLSSCTELGCILFFQVDPWPIALKLRVDGQSKWRWDIVKDAMKPSVSYEWRNCWPASQATLVKYYFNDNPQFFEGREGRELRGRKFSRPFFCDGVRILVIDMYVDRKSLSEWCFRESIDQRDIKFLDVSSSQVFCNEGVITCGHLESNILFLGTNKGCLHAYTFEKFASLEKDIDLHQPTFCYCHEREMPVLSISVLKYNRNSESVKIVVHYADRLKVITKKPSSALG